MTHTNPSADELRALLSSAKTIAVVGASSNPARPSHGIFRKLLSHGYRVIPVNPNESTVHGEKAYPSLEAVPDKVDIVDVFRRAEATPPVAESAVKIGARALWLQSGISNDEAAARAKAGGLAVVMDTCIGVELSLLQVPPKLPRA
jgi:predicted CoA-binding protein